VTRALTAAPIVALAFVAALMLAATAMRLGLVPDDAVRLWAGASTASSGDVSIGRIVAAYPTVPFLSTTLVALITPDSTPAPILVAAAVFAYMTGVWFVRFRDVGLPILPVGAATLLIAFHPMLLRAVIGGPADIFLALFLFMAGSALYDLRAHSTTSDVMAVGLALFALAFSHPMGAAVTFAAVPFLIFAVRPVLVASSPLNVIVALLFPTVFGIGAFIYVSWIFPGAGWSYFAAPAESLSTWSVGIARIFGDGPTGKLALDAILAIGAALMLSAPIAIVALAWVIRRRPLIAPPLVFAATLITATAITGATGLFGDPTALAVGAPVLAAIVMTRVPIVRERLAIVIPLLAIGWIGGVLSLALIDPATATRVSVVLEGRGGDVERIDALAAGGAMIGREGVLVDSHNAPAFVVGHGGARGVFDPSSEPFALALLFSRIETPFVAIPDPQSTTGVGDRLNKAFPTLYRDGAAGYRIVYQNITWRLFGRI
jgi:hypothetical protein